MLELLLLSRQYGIWPQRDVIKYIRSAIALDGLVKTFTPGMDIGRHLEQACERHIKWDSMRNLISPEALRGWFGGYAHMVRDGYLRAFTALHRAGTEKSTPPVLFDNNQQETKRHARLGWLQLGWIAVCLALMWKPGQLTWTQVMAPLLLLATTVIIWQTFRRPHPSASKVEKMKS